MVCFEMKGGIGTASRVVHPVDRRDFHGTCAAGRDAGPAYTVGVMVLANFGRIERLTIDGVRVGEALARGRLARRRSRTIASGAAARSSSRPTRRCWGRR